MPATWDDPSAADAWKRYLGAVAAIQWMKSGMVMLLVLVIIALTSNTGTLFTVAVAVVLALPCFTLALGAAQLLVATRHGSAAMRVYQAAPVVALVPLVIAGAALGLSAR